MIFSPCRLHLAPAALLALCAGLSLSGCDLFGSDSNPFPWAKRGNEFVYDFQPGDSSLTFADGTPIPYSEDAGTVRIEAASGETHVFTEKVTVVK